MRGSLGLFPCLRSRFFYPYRFPRCSRGASSLAVRSSSELLRSLHRARLSTPALLPGSRPSSRPHPLASTDRATGPRGPRSTISSAPARGIQSRGRLPHRPLRSVLRRSQPLDGLLRDRARGLVSSRSHVQDHSVQGLLSPRSSALSSRPPCPLAFRSVRAPRLPGCHPYEPRLRGFAPRGAALHQRAVRPADARSPLRVTCSSRLLPLTLAAPSSLGSFRS
jgi:hypothetical protein